jgi:hypothetical protein
VGGGVVHRRLRPLRRGLRRARLARRAPAGGGPGHGPSGRPAPGRLPRRHVRPRRSRLRAGGPRVDPAAVRPDDGAHARRRRRSPGGRDGPRPRPDRGIGGGRGVVGARVYRGGIVRTGARTKMRDALRSVTGAG